MPSCSARCCRCVAGEACLGRISASALRPAPGARSVVLVACGLVAYVAFSVLWALGVLHEHASKGPLSGVRRESTIDIVLAVIAATVSAPVVEEIFFRGLLYRSLRNRLSVLPATVIAGAIFGAAHISVYHPSELPVLAVFGAIACQLYERTGSLLPGIALHSFVDSSGIDIELAGNDLIVVAVFGVLAATLLVRASVARPRAAAHPGVSGTL
jgi:membrane protease YdiL (CAAX protease family)